MWRIKTATWTFTVLFVFITISQVQSNKTDVIYLKLFPALQRNDKNPLIKVSYLYYNFKQYINKNQIQKSSECVKTALQV